MMENLWFRIFLISLKKKLKNLQKELWAKIIPDLSDGYKNLLNFLTYLNKLLITLFIFKYK